MDPISVSVAFVGFAASLTTLAALVVDSSRTLYNIRRRLKDAPEDITRLSRLVVEFECLLSAVQEQIRDHRTEYAASGMETLFETAVKHMENDMEGFKDTMRRLKGLLSASASPRRRLELRIRHVLQEERVGDYQRLIASHIGTLTLLMEILSSRKLYNISIQTTDILAKTDSGLGAIHSDLAALHSSQNFERNHYQGALATIEKRLCALQEQLGVDTVRRRRGEIGKSVVAKDFRSLSSNRRTCIDLVLLGRVISSRNFLARKGWSRPTVYHCTFTFIPPPWLSHLVLQWEMQVQKLANKLPQITISLSPIRYNSNRELKAVITNFDIAGLQRLFRTGLARPTDYVLDRRPISLLEAFAARVGKMKNETLGMYKYLLKEGCGNGDPLLAASHAQVLISLSKHSQQQLRDALDSFLAHGGNIFWQHSNWGTILSLIMRHGASFECLHEYLFRQPEPWMANELLPIDRWLVGILQHVDTNFRKALRDYTNQYRSIFQASQVHQNLSAIYNLNDIVAEVKSASTRDRIEFLKIISKWGTGDMMVPFIKAGLDLDEESSNKRTPWLRLSYLGKAVRWGNPDMFRTLLAAGACPTQALIYLSRHSDSLPQCEYPESRKEMILTLVKGAEPRRIEGDHEKLLALLLRTDDIRRYSSAAADGLIEKIVLLCHNLRSQSQELLDSYILATVFLDIPQVLQYFYRNCFRVNGNEPIGKVICGQHVSIKGDVVGKYTWLTFAVHLGRASIVKLFIENGADCMISDPCGRTALDLVKDYVSKPHPRTTTGLYIWPYQPPQRFVSAEDDQKTLATLQLTTNTEPCLVSCSGHQSDEHSGTYMPTWTEGIMSRVYTQPYITFTWIQILRKVLKYNCLTTALWGTAAKLSRLTFIEALLMRTGLVVSIIAFLFYGVIDIILHVQDMLSA